MEGSVSNLISPGDKVLVLTAGKFGERWRDLAKAFGCAVELVSAPYGETFSLDEVSKKLTSDVRAVYVQATESSTGARHDVEGIAKLDRAQGDETLLVVDAITGLGTTHFDLDGWGVDVIIGGSQKALMIPPGLAYCAVSERAWKRMETAKSPRYYFDFRKERKAAAKGESAYTPATSLFAALGAALDFIRQMGNGDLAAGREALINNAELAAEMTRAGAKALGLKLFAASSPAAALTAIQSPAGADSNAIVKEFRESFAAVVANGRDEGQAVPHRAPGLLRLSRHYWNSGRARARTRHCNRQASGIWLGRKGSAGSVRPQPVRKAATGRRLSLRRSTPAFSRWRDYRAFLLLHHKGHGVGSGSSLIAVDSASTRVSHIDGHHAGVGNFGGGDRSGELPTGHELGRVRRGIPINHRLIDETVAIDGQDKPGAAGS
jgi:aspartate aminotransferase-like enzyme